MLYTKFQIHSVGFDNSTKWVKPPREPPPGFFMVLVDVGQLFRCTGQHFMCVATGPPIRGDPISQSQAHIPLKPLPPALDPFPALPVQQMRC